MSGPHEAQTFQNQDASDHTTGSRRQASLLPHQSSQNQGYPLSPQDIQSTSFSHQGPTHFDAGGTSHPFSGPYTMSTQAPAAIAYSHTFPFFSQPQLTHPPATSSSHPTYALPALQPIHNAPILPYPRYTSDMNVSQNAWGIHNTHTAALSYSQQPMWEQPFNPSLNLDMNSSQRSRAEPTGPNVPLGSSTPAPYGFLPHHPFTSHSLPSPDTPSADSMNSPWWRLPPNLNPPTTSPTSMRAFPTDFYTSHTPTSPSAGRPPMPRSSSYPFVQPLQNVPTRQPVTPHTTSQRYSTPLELSMPQSPQLPLFSTTNQSRHSVLLSSRERSVPEGVASSDPDSRKWAMWVGNVPADATTEELFNFFNQTLPKDENNSSPSAQVSGGVTSVFLIRRSNCAFVNFESASHLEAATATFNGRQLREDDPHGPRLVCRIRRQDDDGNPGLTGQRHSGIHVQWVREHQGGTGNLEVPEVGTGSRAILSGERPVTVEDITSQLRFLSRIQDSGGSNQGPLVSDPDPSTSTSSSMLSRYFPQRYFILKSRSQAELDRSIQTATWTTQKHHEGVLNRAYRTSQDVLLIFSVNKSGEFYGYARMAGPIESATPELGGASTDQLQPGTSASPLRLLSASRWRERSPESWHEGDHSQGAHSYDGGVPSRRAPAFTDKRNLSAPPELGSLHLADLPVGAGYDDSAPLPWPMSGHDPIFSPAPHRPYAETSMEEIADDGRERSEDVGHTHPSSRSQPAELGSPFKVQWISTIRLPFTRTRHLRNPWNHDRQIKVSRDGTELEPEVARQLLQEWTRSPPSTSAQNPSRGRPHASSRQPHRRRARLSAATNTLPPSSYP